MPTRRAPFLRRSPSDNDSLNIKITGIKPAPRVSGGAQEEYKIAVFNYESADPEISAALACFEYDALFIQYDDGWRLETMSVK